MVTQSPLRCLRVVKKAAVTLRTPNLHIEITRWHETLCSRVTAFNDDENRDAARAMRCASCGSTLGSTQRYCLECGTRRAPLPPLVAARIGALQQRGDREEAKAEGQPPAAEGAGAAAEGASADELSLEDRFMPGPRVAGVAVMGLLAFGVFLGSATSPLAQSAGIAPILLDEGSSAATPSSSPASTPESTPPESAPAASPELPCRLPLKRQRRQKKREENQNLAKRRRSPSRHRKSPANRSCPRSSTCS